MNKDEHNRDLDDGGGAFEKKFEEWGRGWAEVQNSQMTGKIFLHMGDESEFVARKATATA
jgi:hypothetical protein